MRGVAAEKRITQERIADILGVTRDTVSRRFNNHTPFTGAELFVLSGAFDVPVARFFPERVA